MDLNETILAEAADEIPVEDFIRQQNARDKGEPVEPLAIKPPHAEGGKAGDHGLGVLPAASPEGADKGTAATAKPAATEPKRAIRETPQQRIDKAIAKQREAERQLQAEKSRAQALEAQLQGRVAPESRSAPTEAAKGLPDGLGVDPGDPEPRLEQFAKEADPYTAWMRATTRWDGRRAYRAEQQQVQQRQRLQGMASHAQQQQAAVAEKWAAYKTLEPKFEDKIDREVASQLRWHDVPRPDGKGGYIEDVGTPLGNLIADSNYTPQLVVYFSEHKSDFQRLSTLHPLLQAAEFGRIEERLAAASRGSVVKPMAVSHAKPPIKPPASSPVLSPDEGDDADDLSEGAVNRHIRRENSRERSHRNLHRLR